MFFVSFAEATNSNIEIARVLVDEGLLEGEVICNEYGGRFYSFKGIPYAEPPLGDLRFKVRVFLAPYHLFSSLPHYLNDIRDHTVHL